MNRVQLIGNLGADADISTTPSGDQVATMNVATTRKYKTRDGAEKEETQWHRVVAWGWMVKATEGLLLKGKRVSVEGSIIYRQWEKADKTIGYSTEIRASELHLVTLNKSSKREEAPLQPPPQRAGRDVAPKVVDVHAPLDAEDDSVPF